MSYTPTQWATGDIITAEKLNKLENGVANAGGGGVLVVHVNENGVLDKTWKEIHDAGVCFLALETSGSGNSGTTYGLIAQVVTNGSLYGVAISQSQVYATDNENGYPAYVEQGGDEGGGDAPQ